MKLPKAVRDSIETAIVNLRRAKEGVNSGVAAWARIKDDAYIYLESWVIGYLEDVLDWDEGKTSADNLRLGIYPSQAKKLKAISGVRLE